MWNRVKILQTLKLSYLVERYVAIRLWLQCINDLRSVYINSLLDCAFPQLRMTGGGGGGRGSQNARLSDLPNLVMSYDEETLLPISF